MPQSKLIPKFCVIVHGTIWVNRVNTNTIIWCQKRKNSLKGDKHTFTFSIRQWRTRLAFLDKSWYSGYSEGTSLCLICSLKCTESLKLYQKYLDFILKTLYRSFIERFHLLPIDSWKIISWKIWRIPVLGVSLFRSMTAVILTYYWWIETYNVKVLVQNHSLWLLSRT